MSVKPKRNQKSKKGGKFPEHPFDLGRDKSWFNSSRKSGESWCKGGGGNKRAKSTKKKDEY